MNKANVPLLETYNLKRDYPVPKGVLSVLKGVYLRIKSGEMDFIFGRSGSGKSTLLHLLGGLDRPTAGKILFEGEDMTRMNDKELARIRNRHMGFVFQFYHLLPELTVFENVLLPTLISGKRDDKWAKECLKKVKLYSRSDHYPSELSGGEQQRVAIARALVNRPAIVLCDEPTGNLDEETAGTILRLLMELNRREGQTFLIVTHDESMAWHHDQIFRILDGVLMPDVQKPLNTQPNNLRSE